jgi:hypothetical protein
VRILERLFLISAFVWPACGDDGGTSASDASGASTTDASATDATTTDASTTDASTTDATTTTGPGEPTTTVAPTSTSTSTTTDDGTSTGETTGDGVWEDFEAHRASLLETLAPPIVSCIAKVDTDHPVWNGCIDWHSSVHATYALHVIHEHTGDASYLEAAEAKMTPAGLQAELDNVKAVAYPQEIPYGYAWFLTLARARERITGATDLVPLATDISTQLRDYVLDRTPAQFEAGMLRDDYLNLSWAILNLWQWGQFTGDAALAAEMEELLLPPAVVEQFDALCPFAQEETDADDFFPPCLHRALALATMWPQRQTTAWLGTWLPADPVLTPIAMPAAAHISGLNFSRAWGLYAGYRATGDTVLRDLYLDHLLTHIDHPEYWAEDYYNYSHWVAQFGVHAIALTYER